jgi:hypothetical protein
MGVAVADKATAFGGLVDGGLEKPETFCGVAQRQNGLGVNADAMALLGDSEQVRVSDVGFVEVFHADSFVVHEHFLLIGCFTCKHRRKPSQAFFKESF